MPAGQKRRLVSIGAEVDQIGQVWQEGGKAQVDELKARMRVRLPADAAGRITYGARANAIKGRVPG